MQGGMGFGFLGVQATTLEPQAVHRSWGLHVCTRLQRCVLKDVTECADQQLGFRARGLPVALCCHTEPSVFNSCVVLSCCNVLIYVIMFAGQIDPVRV